jgi:uncharacterized membrane protein YccF (DUF307 family)
MQWKCLMMMIQNIVSRFVSLLFWKWNFNYSWYVFDLKTYLKVNLLPEKKKKIQPCKGPSCTNSQQKSFFDSFETFRWHFSTLQIMGQTWWELANKTAYLLKLSRWLFGCKRVDTSQTTYSTLQSGYTVYCVLWKLFSLWLAFRNILQEFLQCLHIAHGVACQILNKWQTPTGYLFLPVCCCINTEENRAL